MLMWTNKWQNNCSNPPIPKLFYLIINSISTCILNVRLQNECEWKMDWTVWNKKNKNKLLNHKKLKPRVVCRHRTPLFLQTIVLYYEQCMQRVMTVLKDLDYSEPFCSLGGMWNSSRAIFAFQDVIFCLLLRFCFSSAVPKGSNAFFKSFWGEHWFPQKHTVLIPFAAGCLLLAKPPCEQFLSFIGAEVT